MLPLAPASEPKAVAPSVGLLRVYFAAQPQDTEIQCLLSRHIAEKGPIPALKTDDRRYHRQHLEIIATLVGQLPAASSAEKALRQYQDVFEAVESHAAQIGENRRMRFHPGGRLERKGVIGLQYGLHILLFRPSGAIDWYRRNTPPEIDILPGRRPDYGRRMAYFRETEQDFQVLLSAPGGENAKRLGAQRYTHRVVHRGNSFSPLRVCVATGVEAFSETS
jgi:hypothetical protein